MTREEAITVLKAFMKNPLFSEVHKAAFNIAIHDIKAYQDWNINNLILVNKDNYEPTTKNNLGVKNLCDLCGNAINCPMQAGIIREECGLYKPIDKNNLRVDCIKKSDAIDIIQDMHGLARADVISDAVNRIITMPPVTPQLSVSEVTALAEWTEKLIKANKSAYSQGYADGMKAQEPRKGHWINTANPRMSDNIVCSECGYDSIADFKFCPCCGADMREVEE